LLHYDGVAEVWPGQPADLSEMFQSSEYQQVVIPDEEKLPDRSKTEHSITG
jgi:EthD domain